MKSSSNNNLNSSHDMIWLCLITIAALAAGILLIVLRPSFWIVSEMMSVCIGVLFLLLAVMYIPFIIHRWRADKNEK